MNIAEIAKLAGVSSAAVSRYFNNGYISEEKRDAIRKVVEETGYRPSVQAQTLRTKKTKLVGVIAPKMASAAIGSVVDGILSVLNESGYQMLLAVTQNDYKKELEYLRSFNDKQVDGVLFVATIITPEHKRTLKAMSVPVIIIGQQVSGYCCVYHDDYHAIYDMTEYFFQQGRKNLGFVSAILQDKAAGSERCKGYQDAVNEHGCSKMAEQYAVATHFTVRAGYDKAKELLEKYPDLDGMICATDEMAVGAMQYLKEIGKKVPEDVLVSGQGDSILAKVCTPPLKTIHYSYEKSGQMAVQMLLEILGQGNTALKEIKLGYALV
ncbi:MAG: LacI family DNA-binding transcriptional regulator [Lachnospiraceae bacterium]